MNATVTRRIDPSALIKGEPFTVLRAVPVYGTRPGDLLDGNVESVEQLHEMVKYFRTVQEPSGEYPLIDYDHKAIGGMASLMPASLEERLPLGAVIDMQVEGDGLVVTPAWTKHGRSIMDKAEGLWHPSATYALEDVADRATGKRAAGAALFAFAVTPQPATRPDQLGQVRSAPNAVKLYVGANFDADVVAAWPPESDQDPHVTIAFALIAPHHAEAASLAVCEALAGLRQASVRLGDVDYFRGNPDGDVAFITIGRSDCLSAMRRTALDALQAAGVPYTLTHGGEYRPHATLAYLPADAVWKGELLQGPATLVSLSVQAGSKAPAKIPLIPAASAASQEEVRGMTRAEFVEAYRAMSDEDKAAILEEVAPAPAPEERAEEMDDLEERAAQAEAEAVHARNTNAELISRLDALTQQVATLAEDKRLNARAQACAGIVPHMRSVAEAVFDAQGAEGVERLFAQHKVDTGVTGKDGQPRKDAPPANEAELVKYVKRNQREGENFADALNRIKAAFPDKYRAAALREGVTRA